MKNVVVTGATSGIGKEVALKLLKEGYSVISNCRNLQKANSIREELTDITGNKNIHFFEGDFASFTQVLSFAKHVKEKFENISILINNAGTWEMKFIETKDGIETNFQVNHLSPMLLTLELIPLLEKTGDARIINTSSGAHRRNILNFEDIEFRNRPYDGIATYSQSKLCNLLFSLVLSQKLKGKNITVNTVHPGYVKTELFSKMENREWNGVPDASHGARSAIYAALSSKLIGVSAKYFYLEHEEPEISLLAKDIEKAKKLWDLSITYFKKKLEGFEYLL